MYHFLPEIISEKGERFFKQVAKGKENFFEKEETVLKKMRNKGQS